MSLRDLYEGVWESVPEGAEPLFAAKRLAYLRGHLRQGQRVLDIGCGEAWFTQALSGEGFAVVGVDVAEEPLRRARRRCSELDLRLLDDQGMLPFADAEIDVVWAGETIEHVADTVAWLSEVRRVLRPGGLLVLSTPAHDIASRLALALWPAAFEAHFDPRADHLRFYTHNSLRALLGDFRFVEVKVESLGGLPGARRCLLASAKRARF